MADKMGNISGLFKESRSRVIVLITMFLLFATMAVGFLIFKKETKGPEVQAQLHNAPANIKNIPGGFEQAVSPEYAKLLEIQNASQAQEAMKAGTSAVPTIIRSEALGGETSAAAGGLGFSSLNRSDRAGGTQKTLGADEDKTLGVICTDGTVRDALGNLIGRTGAVAPGTVVYDENGNVIGVVGADGIVRDAKGNIIGRVGADGLVRDASGKIVGKASTVAPGTLIYDAQGRVIGTVGADGLVRDANGNVIGRVGVDGIVRDTKGNIIGRAGCAAPGTAVYNPSGALLGSVAKDGTVSDKNGKSVGKVGSDCNVRDAQGNIVGRAGAISPGTAVYDSQGRLIGYVGADGLVRNAKGEIIGTVGADGIVRDAKGNIIGRAGALAPGTLVYDSQGRVIGTVSADGAVRDANGNVIGTVGADGVVRDTQGKLLGKTSPVAPGRLVYDANGNVIGIVGADGVVRDMNGNVIGKVGADGVVRDVNGNVIGKVGDVLAGGFIHKDACSLVGTVDNNGSIRNLKGVKMGKVSSDGVAKDSTGQVIGKAGATAPGQMVLDTQGQIIGKVGADAKVRDAKGTIIGKVCADGTVRNVDGDIIGKVGAANVDITAGATVYDTQGKPLGVVQKGGVIAPIEAKVPVQAQTASPQTSSTPSGIPSLGSSSSSAADLQTTLLKRQAEQASLQQRDQMKQQLQSAMQAQATQLFASWTPIKQDYVPGNADKDAGGLGAGGSQASLPGQKGSGAMIKAGTIFFAVLNTAVNTDQPGPVLATIVEGKYKGSRLVGTVVRQEDKAVLTFNALNVPNISTTVSINSIAIDQDTARIALASKVDNHYLLRYGSLFAASFLQGYGQAVAQAGAVITTSGLNTQTAMPPLNGKDKLVVAMGSVGQQWGARLSPIFSKPPTVYVDSGSSLGILFLADVAQVAN